MYLLFLKNPKVGKTDLTGITTYDELPEELKEYIESIENTLQVPIKIVAVDPDRKQTILK